MSSRQDRARYREKIKQYIRDIKESKPCTDCGLFYPYYVMDFDHLDGNNKTHNPGHFYQRYGIKRIDEELAKCELVCANCHRKRTHLRRVATQSS